MTLDEILSGNAASASEQLKKIFMLKSFKSRIGNVRSNTQWFKEKIQRNVISIADGKLSNFGIYGNCCEKVESSSFPSVSSSPAEKTIPEELKPELFKVLKESAFKALENYKKELDDYFGVEEKKEEPEQKSVETADTGAEASTETEANISAEGNE